MILLTLGDPCSVNIEILYRLRAEIEKTPVPFIIVGSLWHWEKQGDLSNFSKWQPALASPAETLERGVYFWDIGHQTDAQNPKEMDAKHRGAIALRALEALKDVAKAQRKFAFVTGPIDKKACSLAGFKFPGQTEYFESLAGVQGIMVLAGPKLKVGLVTNHLPLHQVSQALTRDLVQQKIVLFDRTLRDVYQLPRPNIAVVGLNPHCGDGGLFGDEEKRIIAPAIEAARGLGITVTGPVPADTAFFHGYQQQYDGILAMYHDQGLGPLKTVHFYDAVNITGGLPFLRISPDHGPAKELFGKNQANTESFRQSMTQAFRYFQ